MSRTAVIRIKYLIGASADPKGKEGLVHFVEHCLLKAQIKERNLISLCERAGAFVNAKTSMKYIEIEIKIINSNLLEFLNHLSDFYREIMEVRDLENEYILGEKKTIIQEMRSKESTIIGNRILGTEKTINKLKKTDILCMISLVLYSKAFVDIMNVSEKDACIVCCILENIFKKYDRTFNRRQVSISVEKENKINILKNLDHNKCNLQIVQVDLKEKFLIISMYVSTKVRKCLKDISNLLLCYMNINDKDLKIKIGIEVGCLNILLLGPERNVLGALKRIINLNPQEVVKIYQKQEYTKGHILEEIHFQLLHQGYRYEGYEKSDIYKALRQFINPHEKKPSIITNINKEKDILEALPQRKRIIIRKEVKYTLNNLKMLLPKNEYVELWETPSYFSKEKYKSHIVWIMLSGTTGELYKRLVLKEQLCYSFTFYPREFIDYGYSVLYIKAEKDCPKHLLHSLCRQIIKELKESLNGQKLELAKRQIMSVKKEEKSKINDYMNLAMINLFQQRNQYDYCEEINKITLNEVQTYIEEYLLVDTKITL